MYVVNIHSYLTDRIIYAKKLNLPIYLFNQWVKITYCRVIKLADV